MVPIFQVLSLFLKYRMSCKKTVRLFHGIHAIFVLEICPVVQHYRESPHEREKNCLVHGFLGQALTAFWKHAILIL